jgi:hypothetical protein
MMRSASAGLLVIGALLVLLGIAGLAMPSFSTRQTTDVAKIGNLKVQANEDTPHFIPPAVSEGALVVGIVLLGAGFLRRT